jgi:N-acetylglucosamine-6-phosphate deacetylase
MIIKNCKIIFENRIETGSVLIKDNKIYSITSENLESDEHVIDAGGKYLAPGFIDVHIHGAGGHDTMDGTYEALNCISKTIVKHGTTSFLPTTMTVALDDIKTSVETISYAKEHGTDGANVLGVHLEGPFISPQMIGAQNPKYVAAPSIEAFNYIVGNNIDSVVSITLAPEVPGAEELIKYLKSKGIVVSIGHSKATYAETVHGIQCGICHSTHLYNAMTGLHHRESGVVGAIFDTDITTETISDGIHISYPSLRIAYRTKGTDKVILVTDAMMACGMADGKYALGGQDVFVKDNAARLENGALAGSVLTLDKAIRNVYKNTDYKLYDVVKMATVNPAKLCKVDDKKGRIAEGYDADLVIFDEDINIERVIVNGKVVV